MRRVPIFDSGACRRRLVCPCGKLSVEQLVCGPGCADRRMWLVKRRQQLLPSSFRSLLPTSPLLRLLSAAAIRGRPSPQPPASRFVVDYLVSSCGLSCDEAAKACSRSLARLKSPEKPDAVLCLLKREGLSIAQIRRVVLGQPTVLVADPATLLEPKIRVLREAGYSGSDLAQLITSCPRVLILRNALPRIEFWRDLLGNNQNLLKAASKYGKILDFRLNEGVVPKLSLLRNMGVPEDKVGTLILRNPRLISCNVDKIKVACEQVKSMGFTPGSTLFAQALWVVLYYTTATMDAKFELLRSTGWSQADATRAFRSFPNILTISEKKIRSAMDFLLKEAGCDPSYIAGRPALLAYNLEKRLMPRHYVLQFLRAAGPPEVRYDFYTAVRIPEREFVDKYIAPHSDKFPNIVEMYHAVGTKAASDRWEHPPYQKEVNRSNSSS